MTARTSTLDLTPQLSMQRRLHVHRHVMTQVVQLVRIHCQIVHLAHGGMHPVPVQKPVCELEIGKVVRAVDDA